MEIFTNKQRKRFPLQKINNNGGIFEIKKCKCSCAGDLEDGNDIMYIGAKKDDNGFMKMVAREEKLVTKGNCMVFICDGQGSVGYSNYIDRDFIGSTTLSVGYNKNLNANIGMFFVTLLDLERRKYSYGRKYGTNLGKSEIKLPIDNNGNPDRNFMENYIKSLLYRPITTKNKPGKYNLNIDKWQEFKIGDLFNVINGKGLTIEEIEDNPGDVFCIQGGEGNNGCIGTIDIEYCKIKSYKIIDECCLTVARVGTAGCVNFWSSSCAIGDKCKALLLKTHGTKNTYLFMQTILNQLQYKYTYGRGLVTDKYMNEIIKLPVDNSGNPDREFMENYIKNLPYGDRI